MNNYDFYAGFARVDITPSLDVPIIGYYVERKVEGVLDNLEVNAVALKVNDKKFCFCLWITQGLKSTTRKL